MAIETKTVTVCTCDLCKQECDANEGDMSITVNGGFRDVGPTTLDANWKLKIPYGPQKPIACRACIEKLIAAYLRTTGWEVSNG